MKTVAHFMNIIKKKSKKDCKKIQEYMKVSPTIIFDIGANVGMYSLFFAQQWPEATIYSFEPVEDTYKILVENVKMNGFNNIKTFNYGLYKENISSEMGIPDNRESENVGLYTIKHDEPLKDLVVCEFRNVNDVLADLNIENIDLVKIDAEGSEFDILSCGDILSISKYLHIEFNTNYEGTSDLESLLLDNNFEHIKRTRKGNRLWGKK